MKKTAISSIILFIFFLTIFIPCSTSTAQSEGTAVLVHLQDVTRNGYFIYNVTNLGPGEVSDITFNVSISGGGMMYSLYSKSTFFVDHLDNHECGEFKTKGEMFTRKDFPILHRPLVGGFIELISARGSTLRLFLRVVFNRYIETQ
jgi:hypothetical protein